MSAPDRIYLDGDAEAGDGYFTRCFETAKPCSEPAIEYARADLCDPMQDERVRALEAENARLREALEYIQKPQYGLQSIIEDGDSDEEIANYFCAWCRRYQDRARAALRALEQP